MQLSFEERPSDSSYVERIWRTSSDNGGLFTSVALSNWQMCIWTQYGKTHITVRGPETHATHVPCPPETAFLGIVFKHGTFMPHFPASSLVDADATLAEARSQTVWLNSEEWEIPSYDNADTFVDWLVHEGMLVREPIVQAVLQAEPQPMSVRSIQRRFTQATGLTHSAIAQIDRARLALILLREGISILDAVDQAGYADQAHLTRSLKRYTGYTPAQIQRTDEPVALSFLFKTQSP